MVIPAVLLAVSPVVMPAVPVTVGVYDPSGCWFYHYDTRWRRWNVIVPVTMPVAIVITRFIGSIRTGGYGDGCDHRHDDPQHYSVCFHGSSSFCTIQKTNRTIE